ncbi:hypothetical protein [Bradyrhizobium sp. I1.8.5]|uniref:hypothetical protein n=1 Tax=Bradyrhizobium sp. I1.8.5 TaxID=3156365 RepID=UPI00339B6BF2
MRKARARRAARLRQRHRSLHRSERYSKSIGEARLMVGEAIRMMCRAPKSRAGCHFAAAFGLRSMLEDLFRAGNSRLGQRLAHPGQEKALPLSRSFPQGRREAGPAADSR